MVNLGKIRWRLWRLGVRVLSIKTNGSKVHSKTLVTSSVRHTSGSSVALFAPVLSRRWHHRAWCALPKVQTIHISMWLDTNVCSLYTTCWHFKDFSFIPVLGSVTFKPWEMGVITTSYPVKTWDVRYLQNSVPQRMFLPQAVGTKVNKNGLSACQKQLYNLITVMPPPSSTHTCAHCPSKSCWVISLGGGMRKT